jgi:hypothetical protein
MYFECKIVKDFLYMLFQVLECFQYKQFISKLVSSVNYKADGLGRDRCRNKERSLLLGNNKRQKISVFSVPRSEKLTIVHY